MWPLVLFALVVVVLIGAAYLFGQGSQPTKRDPGILRRRSKWRRWLPVVPLLGAVGCLALAFSGFRVNLQQSAPIAMLALDASDSMNATDMEPTRLAAAQLAAREFVEQLPEDFEVGLATFASAAEVVVAPTLDREAIFTALVGLTTSNGTVIGDGLDTALGAIAERRGDGEVPAAVLLLSDGRDTGSVVAPPIAAAHARDQGVPVYTVLAGQAGENGAEGAADPETLANIARTSGGATFTAETTGQLTARFATIGSQLSVDLDVRPSATPLVIVALALVVLAGFLLILTPR